MRRLGVILIALVALVGSFCVGRGSVSSNQMVVRSSALSHVVAPPPITEEFTPLLCSQLTTLGLEGCTQQTLLRLDTNIDASQRSLFGLVRTTSAPRDFDRAAKDWLVARRSESHSAADVYAGGTLSSLSSLNVWWRPINNVRPNFRHCALVTKTLRTRCRFDGV